MKSVFAVVLVGILGFVATLFDPALEMWGPLIVSVVPILVFMMWPVRDDTEEALRSAHRKVA